MSKYNLTAQLITCYPQYIEEWLCHYINVGIEHFYIFDNDPTRETYEKVKPYIKDGLVTYEYHSKFFRECYLLQKCIKEHGKDTKWFVKLDNDEFIFPEHHSTLLEEIKNIEKLYAYYNGTQNSIGVIYLDWIEYGDWKALKYEPKLMMERFKYHVSTQRVLDTTTGGRSILNPLAFDYKNCWDHIPVKIHKGYDVINTDGKVLRSKQELPHNRLLLHHYRYRSLEEYNEQRLNVRNLYNGEIYTKADISKWEKHNTQDRFCIKSDFADKFIPRVYELIDHYRKLNEDV